MPQPTTDLSDSAYDDDVTDEEELDAGLPSNFRVMSARIDQRKRQVQQQKLNPGGGYGAASRTDSIMKRFASKVLDTAANQTPRTEDSGPKKINLFISYCWSIRKEAVHEMARHLMQQPDFKVWIDMQDMATTSKFTFESMARGIDEADVVVVFFSKAYAESPNCRREIEYAANKNKDILPVRVERGYRPDGWLLFIFKSQLRFDFCDDESFVDIAGRLCEHIRGSVVQALPANSTSGYTGGSGYSSYGSVSTASSEVNVPISANFKCVGVPFFSKSKYFAREEDENRVLQQMKNVGEAPDDGCLVICGDGGVGKTTLMARLLNDEKNHHFFAKDCDFQRVIWINCFDWRENFDEKAFVDKILQLAKDMQGEQSASFPSIQSITAFYKRKNMKVAYVLDDMFNYHLLQSFLEKQSDPCACFVVTRDAQTIMETCGSMVQKVERVEEMTDAGIKDMLKQTFKLNRHLTEDQIMKLAQLCCGLPLIASLIAARINNCEDKQEVKAEYKVLSSPQYRISDLKTKDRSFKTVSNLFTFSLDQMDASMRMLYYAFLLFNPAEPVSIFDLGVLWGFNLDDDFRCGLRGVCRAFEKRSLVRRVKRQVTDAQLDEEATSEKEHPTEKYNDEFEDRFLVHQMLYESALLKARNDFRLPHQMTDEEALLKIRLKIISGETGSYSAEFGATRDEHDDSGLGVWVSAFNYRRKVLIERFLTKLDPPSLADFAARKSAKLTNGMTLLHYLFHFKWEKQKERITYFGMAMVNPLEVHTNLRILKRMLLILKKTGKDTVRRLISERQMALPDVPSPSCLLVDAMKMIEGVGSRILDNALLGAQLLPWFRDFVELNYAQDVENGKSKNHPLIWAAYTNDVDEVERLLASNDLPVEALNGAVCATAHKGNLEIAKKIVDQFPETLESKGTEDLPPVGIAVMSGHLEMVKYFYEKWPEGISATDKGGISVFALACKNGELEVAKFLYEKVPECIRQVDKENHTPLMTAAIDDRLEIVKFLCEKCPETIKERDKDLQCTALGFAALMGNREVMAFLLQHTHDFEDKAKAYLMAASNGQTESVKFLIEKFPEIINHVDPILKGTALQLAAGNGHFECVELLWGKCNSRVKVPEAGNIELSALHMAVACGHYELTQFVYYKDPDAAMLKNPQGQTVLDVAKQMGNKEIIAFLEDVMASQLEEDMKRNTKPKAK